MSRILVSLLLLTFAVTGLAFTARAQQQEQTTPYEEPGPQWASEDACQPDRILVKVRPGADPATVVGRYGGNIEKTISGIQVQVVTVPRGNGQAALTGLNADPEVEYAEADQIVNASEVGSGC